MSEPAVGADPAPLEDEDPPDMPVSSFDYACLSQDHSVGYPDNIRIREIRENFINLYDLYNDNALVNVQKVIECYRNFKSVLGLNVKLHMQECFQVWRNKITEPVFRVAVNNESGYIKEVTVRGEHIPREIWEAQKHIRELLLACQLFLDQHEQFQRFVQEGLLRIKHQIQNIGSFELRGTNQRNLPNIEQNCRELLTHYESITGKLSQFNHNIENLMKEIKNSVNVLA